MKRDAHDFSHYKEAVIGAAIDIAKTDDRVVFVDSDLPSRRSFLTDSSMQASLKPTWWEWLQVYPA